MGFDANAIFPYKSGLSKYYKPFIVPNDAFVELDNCYSQRGSISKREGSTVLARTPVWATATLITDATPPVVTSAGHGLSTGDMVYLENVIVTQGTVNDVVPGVESTVVTLAAGHGFFPFTSGDTVVFTGVTGITPQDGGDFNNQVYQITSVTATRIVINVLTTGTWLGGGTAFVGNLEKQAFVITVIGANSFSLQVLNTQIVPRPNMQASGRAQSADIYLPIVGTRTFLIPSTDNQQLIVFTPKNAWLLVQGNPLLVDISFNTAAAPILWDGLKDDFVYTSNYSTVMWATNNIFNHVTQPVGIRFYNGSPTQGWADFQPLVSGATTYLNSALMILPYKGRLVALNTTEGTNAAAPGQTNNTFFNRARWSQVGTPFVANAPSPFSNDANAWRDDIPGKGGYIDADTSERIVSCGIIQDTLIVNFQFSTWRLRYTADPTSPFIWERINTSLGSEGTFTTIPFDTDLLAISRRGIIASTFNDVDRIDLEVPDFVSDFFVGSDNKGIQRIHGIRDFDKRMVYWIYGEQDGDYNTPNKILCYNYQDKTWSTFTQGFTVLGNYRNTSDNTWGTWTTPWNGDTTQWNTGEEQTNSLIVVAGDTGGRVWRIMQEDVSTDNGVNYNFTITTNMINPYFKEGARCKLAYYDLYIENTNNGQVTLENYTDDDPSDAWLSKTVDTNDNAISSNPVKVVKYIRVFLGMTARNHQIKITLSEEQLEDNLIGTSDFQLQGIVFWTKKQGRIKQ